MRTKEKPTTLLSEADAAQRDLLKEQITDVEKTLTDLEATVRRKRDEAAQIERRLVQEGARSNGDHRQNILRLTEEQNVLKAEIAGHEAVIRDTRSQELPEIQRQLAVLQQREADVRTIQELDAMDPEFRDDVEEHGQRAAIADFAAIRQGEIIRKWRTRAHELAKLAERNANNPTVTYKVTQLRNRIGTFCEGTRFTDQQAVAKIADHLNDGWR